MLIRIMAVSAAMVMASACAAGQETPPEGEGDAFITAYLDAFNAHDVDRLRGFWSDDIEWIALENGEATTLISSAEALEDFMTQYFAEHPDVRSEAGERVRRDNVIAFVETATWTDETGARLQEALAVYELEDGRIARFFYFGEPE